MTILLDTHTLVWNSIGDGRLPDQVKSLIKLPENVVEVSIASYWEIAIKVAVRKLVPHDDIETLESRSAARFIETIPISIRALALLAALPFHHKDPFDRLIAATALASGDTLISADPIFDRYGVTRFWD